jgi:hypothetical protein
MLATCSSPREGSPTHVALIYDKPPPPLCTSLPPPLCARALAPPILRRQNASRFAWPPDPMSSWTYILLSPDELADCLRTVCARAISAREVATFFAEHLASAAADASDESRPAYVEYARAWPHEIEEALSKPDELIAAIVRTVGSLAC